MPDTRHPIPATRHPRSPLPSLVPLSRVAPEPVPWLSPGRLAAGAITLLDGDPGLGKSTLLCDFAARISTGTPLPGGQPAPPAAAIIMSAEDDPHATIRPRIDAAGGDPSRVFAFGVLAELGPGGALLRLPEHVDVLRDVIETLGAALVVVDPLVAFLSPRLNANSDQAVRGALASLKTVAQLTGAAIVAVRHLTKATAMGNPLYRGGGSIGLVGAARTALLLAPDPAAPDRRILAGVKSNLGPSLRPSPSASKPSPSPAPTPPA
jgi:RecA-family ATPase